MDNLLRLRHSRYRQTPVFLKRVKAHAIQRELQLQFLKHHLKFWRFSNDKNLKVDIHPICLCKLFHSLPIGNSISFSSTSLEYRFYNLIYYFIEIFLLDSTKAAIYIALNVTGNNLAFHQTGFRLEGAVRKEETDLDDISLVVLHT